MYLVYCVLAFVVGMLFLIIANTSLFFFFVFFLFFFLDCAWK